MLFQIVSTFIQLFVLSLNCGRLELTFTQALILLISFFIYLHWLCCHFYSLYLCFAVFGLSTVVVDASRRVVGNDFHCNSATVQRCNIFDSYIAFLTHSLFSVAAQTHRLLFKPQAKPLKLLATLSVSLTICGTVVANGHTNCSASGIYSVLN